MQRQFVMTTRKSQIYREALTLSRYRMRDQSRKRPYRPNGIRPEVWERAAPSVFEWDGLSAPHSKYPRILRLYAYSRLAAHCDAQGFPITAEIAFSLETINACVAAQPLVSTSKANLRSWLMEGRQFVLRIPGEPSRTQNRRTPRQQWFTTKEDTEIAYLRDRQSNDRDRRDAEGLTIVGRAAGGFPTEIGLARGTDIFETESGASIVLRGPRAREVPLLGRFVTRALELALLAGEDYIVSPTCERSKNTVNDAVKRLTCDARITSYRLRASWIRELLEMNMAIPALMTHLPQVS